MAMHDVGPGIDGTLRHVGDGVEIAKVHMAAHGQTRETERELRGKLGENRLGPRAAGVRVGNDSDLMAAHGLAAGEIDDMSEQAADRRAQDMKDSQWLVRRRRHGTSAPLPKFVNTSQHPLTRTSEAKGH
jgi:hypothetical protein